MPSNRYYYKQEFQPGQQISLEKAEEHHLISVMRNRVGDKIEVVNGFGQLAVAQIEETKPVKLKIVSVFSSSPESRRRILAQAIPKMSRLEYILEKVTELGVTEICLFPGIQSEKQELSRNQLERVETILINAMKQCGRLFLPKIAWMPPLKKWPFAPLPAFFGDVRAEAPKFAPNLISDSSETLTFFIGPESGFSKDEVLQLEKLEAKGVNLHKNILKTDTAAIIACHLMSQTDPKEHFSK